MPNINEKTIWDSVSSMVTRARRRGVTADEIVQATGYNRCTVSSYLTMFTYNGYATKTDRHRPITSGRMGSVYVKAA